MNNKELVVTFEEQEKIKINLEQEQVSSTKNEKEIVIVFEDNENIQINLEKNQISHDLSNLLQMATSPITNSDGTLILKMVGNTVDINTNIIQRYEDHYDFPNRGKDNCLYIGRKERKIWQWIDGGYELLCDYDYNEIEIINGGTSEQNGE